MRARIIKWQRSRLVKRLGSMSEPEIRAIIKEAKPGMHLHTDPKGTRKQKEESNGEGPVS